jgi:hypothetical protein
MNKEVLVKTPSGNVYGTLVKWYKSKHGGIGMLVLKSNNGNQRVVVKWNMICIKDSNKKEVSLNENH